MLINFCLDNLIVRINITYFSKLCVRVCYKKLVFSFKVVCFTSFLYYAYTKMKTSYKFCDFVFITRLF